MKIAVLDDERFFVEDILERINHFQINDVVPNLFNGFTNPIQFLESFTIEQYDLVFIDVEMEEKDGLEVAREIRKIKQNCIIIFVSGFDYKHDSYKVEAFQYIDKPIDEILFQDELDRAIRKYKRLNQNIIINTYTGNKCIFTRDILYLRTSYRHYYLYTTEKIIEGASKSIMKAKGELIQYHFFQINRSVIINLGQIDTFTSEWLTMNNGETFTIAKKRRKDFKIKYMEYIDLEASK